MNIRILSIIALLCSASVSFGQETNTTFFSSNPPKLVVEVIVGAMRYDQLYRLGKNFNTDGFKKVVEGGSFFRNARYSTINSGSICGAAVLATGANPSESGIVGEEWVDITTNKIENLFYDFRYLGVGCNEDEGQLSPLKLPVTTIADQLKWLSPLSKVFSLALEPHHAILHGGTKPDGCYWYNPRNGGFASSSYYTKELDSWITEFNNSQRKDSYTSELWAVTYPFEKYIYREANFILTDSDKKFSFDMLVRPKNNDFYRLLETPMGNSYLKDFAIETIIKNNLGKDNIVDYLVINMDAHRGIVSKYGAESTESEDSYYSLDNNIADLVDYLESYIGKDNFVLTITSSHGASPNISSDNDIKQGRFNPLQFSAIISGFLNVKYGANNWVTAYKNRTIYLNRPLIYEQGIDLEKMQNHIAAIALQFSGVANAITTTTLQTNYYGTGIANKMQNSYFPRNGGDLIINLLPGWIEVKEEQQDEMVVSGFNSPYQYDVHVPLIFYGKEIKATTSNQTINMVDVAATICEIMGVTPPMASSGQAIELNRTK